MIYSQGNCLTGISFSSHVLCETTLTIWSHQIPLPSSKHFFFWVWSSSSGKKSNLMSGVPLSLGNQTSEPWNWSSAAAGKYTVNVLFSNAYITLSRIQIHKSLIQQLLRATCQHFRTSSWNHFQGPLLPSAGQKILCWFVLIFWVCPYHIPIHICLTFQFF